MKSFLKPWFRKPEPGPEKPPPSTGPGERVYCIGDVHGRHDLLVAIHRMIERDAAGFDGGRTVVYLGDLVDRGMDSREVVEELLRRPLPDCESVFLMGNHEQTMLDFLSHPEQAADWLSWGGRETLASYGVRLPLGMEKPDVVEIRDELLSRIPEDHVEFLRSMPFSHASGDYLFVHAGIRPGVPLQEQSDSDLLWIRNEFLEDDREHGFVVVHGHTITDDVHVKPNRIGIDTGAYCTGVLTCLVLEGTDRRTLQTGDDT